MRPQYFEYMVHRVTMSFLRLPSNALTIFNLCVCVCNDCRPTPFVICLCVLCSWPWCIALFCLSWTMQLDKNTECEDLVMCWSVFEIMWFIPEAWTNRLGMPHIIVWNFLSGHFFCLKTILISNPFLLLLTTTIYYFYSYDKNTH